MADIAIPTVQERYLFHDNTPVPDPTGTHNTLQAENQRGRA